MIPWLLETLFGVTLLMVLVLAVRQPVARFFGAGWAYALWLLPVLRLVLPPLPLPRLGLDIPLPPVAAFIPATGGVTAPLPVDTGPGQWVPFMLALWAGGAVTFLLWHWLAYRAFLETVKACSKPGDPPSYGGIETLASDAVDGPVAIGVIHRLIVQPAHFARRYNPGERRLAMEHELVHHRRGDIWWNMAGLVMLALNWFNPIAWFAFHAFRSDQELACDAAVAKRASGDERHDYARALVKSASRPGLIAACPLNRADQLKRRLRMIRSHRPGRARAAGGTMAFAALLTAGLALSVPGTPAEAEQEVVQVAKAVPTAAAPAPRREVLLAAADRSVPRAVRPARPRPEDLRSRALAFAQAMIVDAGLALPEPESRRFASLDDAIAAAQARAGADGPASPAPATLIRLAEADAASVAGADVKLRLRPARIVTFRVDGAQAQFTVAAGSEPVRVAAVQAALERACAETKDEATRERLGQVIAMLETRKNKIGMPSNHN